MELMVALVVPMLEYLRVCAGVTEPTEVLGNASEPAERLAAGPAMVLPDTTQRLDSTQSATGPATSGHMSALGVRSLASGPSMRTMLNPIGDPITACGVVPSPT